MFGRILAAASILLTAGCQSNLPGTVVLDQFESPQAFAEECKPWDEWSRPGPTFYIDDERFNERTAYVGSCGITMLAVRISNGVVLIDTGEEQFHEDLLRNLAGFNIRPEDVKYILTSHEHHDHVGGLAAMREATGARIITSVAAKQVIETGDTAANDPQFGMHDPMEPTKVWRTVKDGETITLGGKEFTAVHTPGHTAGALTWQWTGKWDDQKDPPVGWRDISIVYADSLSPISSDTYRFSDHPEYVAEYRAGLERLRGLQCDILLTPHPSASKMIERAATGNLEGGITCGEYADAVERRLDKRLAREAEQ